jgi:hypothetical protein
MDGGQSLTLAIERLEEDSWLRVRLVPSDADEQTLRDIVEEVARRTGGRYSVSGDHFRHVIWVHRLVPAGSPSAARH